MTAPRGGPSYWISSTPETSYPALTDALEVDVAVVGAGITGITAATRLKEAGKTVAVIESERAVRGVTGYTTAKLTAGHGLVYSHLERAFGPDASRLYASANTAAVEEVARVAAERGIDCDLERTRNLVYAEREDDVPRLQAEVAAARRAGLPARFVRETELPFTVAGAYVLDDQAQFHPRKYLLPLLALIPGDGSHVFEESRVVAVEAGTPCRVRTSGGGEVRARDVVLATHMPILDRGLFFAKVHPKRSYAVAGAIPAVRAPREMHISVGGPTRSIRSIRDGNRRLLLVGGEGHKVGQEPRTPERYARLEAWARERFGLERVEHRWSTQDNFSVDRVPYAGRLVRGSDHLLAATGFGGWGISNGTVTGMLLADLVLGRENVWAQLYDAKRVKPRVAAGEFAKENANVAGRWLGDRVAAARRHEVADLPPGEGRVARIDGELVAVHRDDAGELRAVAAVCTHLGCVVSWNAAERSWDCPCHGSRFDAGGAVVQGPAVRDLAARDDVLRRR